MLCSSPRNRALEAIWRQLEASPACLSASSHDPFGGFRLRLGLYRLGQIELGLPQLTSYRNDRVGPSHEPHDTKEPFNFAGVVIRVT